VSDPGANVTQVATDQPLIRARGLVKRFGDFTAVNGIDVEVRAGEAFGFLGPNGAGKSSTMRMITVRENLTTYARYFGIPRRVARQRADELLDFVQLAERANSKVEPLSGGMKRRLTIARALVNEPDIVLLDEPTTGLDPQARHLVWERLFRLKQQGVTLVLTTHYMDEAEQLCDRLVVMDGGRIVAEGSPRALIERYSTNEVVELRFAGESQETFAEKLAGIGERTEVLPDRILLYVDDGDAAVAAVHDRALTPASVLVRRSTLEDVFLHLTGRSLVD
jgi:lipooligosaccharide transport system ATP-binding protein